MQAEEAMIGDPWYRDVTVALVRWAWIACAVGMMAGGLALLVHVEASVRATERAEAVQLATYEAAQAVRACTEMLSTADSVCTPVDGRCLWYRREVIR